MPLETYQISSTPPADAAGFAPTPTANARVIAAIGQHHAALAEDLHTLTAAVLDGARSRDYDRAVSELSAWFRTELLPHARAEEVALYGPGSELDETRLLVTGMIAEHRELERLVADLGTAGDPVAVTAAAAAAHALFSVRLAKENDLLLPALDAAGVDLGAALDGMHEILGAPSGPDELDVRSLPHGGRHEIIFAKLDQLDAGESFVIVNDHDPKPLRYQTEALWPGRFAWTYLAAGPELWRVEIARAS